MITIPVWVLWVLLAPAALAIEKVLEWRAKRIVAERQVRVLAGRITELERQNRRPLVLNGTTFYSYDLAESRLPFGEN